MGIENGIEPEGGMPFLIQRSCRLADRVEVSAATVEPEAGWRCR